MFRSISLMGASTGLRMVSGFLVFLIIARGLGPSEFGTFMLWFSTATLLATIQNFGLVPYMLKEAGRTPDSMEVVTNEVMSVKILLTGGLVIGAGVGASLIAPSARIVFAFLLLAQIIDSFIEILNVRYRVTGRYHEEAKYSVAFSVAHVVVVATIAFISVSPLMAASAFFLSRLTTFLALLWLQSGQAGKIKWVGLAKTRQNIKKNVSYAIDFGLQNLFGNIDSLVLGFLSGPLAIGNYQAAFRYYNGGAQASNVFGNVFLPRLSAVRDEEQLFVDEVNKAQWLYLMMGASFGLFLAIASKPLAVLVFGENSEGLSQLLPWIGLLFYMRMVASAWGVVLTSVGEQRYRAYVNGAHWLVVLTAAWLLVSSLGAIGWVMALVGGSSCLGVAYWSRSPAAVRNNIAWLLAFFSGTAAFLVFLMR